ncbi:MAG: hypothetical protein LBU89_02355 [Fibromonadaceae bacterium]|jgi:hypothetical protein|nr:hypothetical protein [Fibromonadaceae bacterium]
MKTLKLGFCLLLILGTQIFAQRFTVAEPDTFRTGSYYSATSNPTLSGYNSHFKQTAALGEKKSAYANVMLFGGRDTLLSSSHQRKVGTYNVVNSHGAILGTVLPFGEPNAFTTLEDKVINDDAVTAVVVLDSLNDTKKTATVLFASLKRLVIMEITMKNPIGVDFKILSNQNMPNPMWETTYEIYNIVDESSSAVTRRLALLGTSLNGANKVYHLVTGNPLSKNGSFDNSGRVDFFSITDNTWTFFQPYTIGLASGVNGLVFNENSHFGKDLAVLDNFDKKGGKALVVLLPMSAQFPSSALYIFQINPDWTPSEKMPIVVAGSSKPWYEYSNLNQNCTGLGVADWEDETTHLLVSCRLYLPANVGENGDLSSIIVIKDIVLDSEGGILNSSTFFPTKLSYKLPTPGSFQVTSNPIAIKNHKNDLHSISIAAKSYIEAFSVYFAAVFTVIDADYSKNYSIEAGKQEIVVDIDSLFYKSGTTGFSAKTLSGLAQCEIQNKNLICNGSENAIGSWSSIELSSASGCDQYKACKRKDTVFVYTRSQSENSNTALRLPKNMLIPYFTQVNLGKIKSLSYINNPFLQNTNISWNANGLKLSAASGNLEDGLTIVPFSQNEGIDTLVFNLSISATTYGHPVHLHVADTAKILENAIPADPGADTVWNVAQKRYIALPRSSSNGNIYTYDITQSGLGTYAEIIDNYLHISKVDVADISVAYTENSQIKHRKITLMPEPKALPPEEDPDLPVSIITSLNQKLSAMHISGGIQINGLNGELELKAYNFKGMEIQSERAESQGSVFIKLKQNIPQVVQIKSGSETIYLKVAR